MVLRDLSHVRGSGRLHIPQDALSLRDDAGGLRVAATCERTAAYYWLSPATIFLATGRSLMVHSDTRRFSPLCPSPSPALSLDRRTLVLSRESKERASLARSFVTLALFACHVVHLWMIAKMWNRNKSEKFDIICLFFPSSRIIIQVATRLSRTSKERK